MTTTKYIIQRVIDFGGETKYFLSFNATNVKEYDGPMAKLGERAYGKNGGNVYSYAHDLHIANQRDCETLDRLAEAEAGLRKSLEELNELRRMILSTGFASTKPLTEKALDKMLSGAPDKR